MLWREPPPDGGPVGVDASDEAWDRIWRINTLAHAFAARAVLPGMLERDSTRLGGRAFRTSSPPRF